MLREEEKPLEKKASRKKDKSGTPGSRMYRLIFFLVRLWLGRKQRLEIDDALMRDVEAPYIMLSNHESFFDFYYLSKLAHPKKPSFLVNEYYCTRPILKTMSRRGGILSKKLFTKDIGAPVGMLRMIRAGWPIVIFPEGRLSSDGRTNPIVERGAAFYKKLGCDIVLVKIDGAYFAAPKWRGKTFRSTVRVKVERVIRKEELRSFTNAELDALIEKTLYHDASEKPFNRYPQRNKAKGLEGILYRCADCGALYTTRGEGSELICSPCGARHRLNERYLFDDDAVSIPAYYDRIKRLERAELGAFQLRADVRTKIFGANGGPIRWEEGACELTRERFHYISENTEITIPTEKLPALAYSCGEEFELYNGDELFYFYPRENPQQTARWALLVDLLREERERDDPV